MTGRGSVFAIPDDEILERLEEAAAAGNQRAAATLRGALEELLEDGAIHPFSRIASRPFVLGDPHGHPPSSHYNTTRRTRMSADSHSQARAALDWLEQDQRERYRPQPKQEVPAAPAATLSIPAVEGAATLSPLAAADLQAAYGMAATLRRMQERGSISTPLLKDR